MLRILTAAAFAIALAAPLGCKRDRAPDSDTATTEAESTDTASGGSGGSGESAAPATSSGAQTTGFDAPVTAADIDLYERALTAEIAEVRKALDKRRSAKTSTDTLAAMSAALDMNTTPAAAEKAGIPVERYRYLESVFGRAISARKMNPAMAKMGEDTSSIAQLPPEAQERARKNLAELRAQNSDSVTLQTIPPELRDQFKQRAATRLDTLWSELFALRARAAGLAP